MEEADSIVLQSLKEHLPSHIGTEDVQHISQVRGTLLAQMIGQYLVLLDHGSNAKNETNSEEEESLREQDRHNHLLEEAVHLDDKTAIWRKQLICSELAKALHVSGFPRTLRFNEILYPSERDSREILSWIAERLGQHGETIIKSDSNRHAKPNNTPPHTGTNPRARYTEETWLLSALTPIGRKEMGFDSEPLSLESKSLVTSQFGRGSRASQLLYCSLLESLQRKQLGVDDSRWKQELASRRRTVQPAETNKQKRKSLGSLLSQIKSKQANRGLQSWSVTGASSSNAFARAALFGEDHPRIEVNKDSEAADNDQVSSIPPSSETDGLQEELEKAESELSQVRMELQGWKLRMAELAEREDLALQSAEHVRAQKAQLESTYKVERRVLEMLPNASENIGQLEQAICEATDRFEALQEEWRVHQDELTKQLAFANAGKSSLESQCTRKIAATRHMKEEMQTILKRVQAQEEIIERLETTAASMPKAPSRSTYTKRILDIVKQVRKQDHEISKVILDIKSIQQSLNHTSEKLRRSELVADEVVFHVSDEARENPTSAKAYRYLHDMRVLFDDLVDLAKKIGAAENTARDFSIRSDLLRTRVSNSNLQQLLQDLSSLQEENSRLQNSVPQNSFGSDQPDRKQVSA